jgi:hypothetical protein
METGRFCLPMVRVCDNRIGKEETPPTDFGASEVVPAPPVVLDPDRRYFFDKAFQLKIFYCFLGTMLVLIGIEASFRIYLEKTPSIMSTVLPVIVPVFTFLLGMGSRSGSER